MRFCPLVALLFPTERSVRPGYIVFDIGARRNAINDLHLTVAVFGVGKHFSPSRQRLVGVGVSVKHCGSPVNAMRVEAIKRHDPDDVFVLRPVSIEPEPVRFLHIARRRQGSGVGRIPGHGNLVCHSAEQCLANPV